MAINLVCIPIIWLFYPETKHRSLEDMEVLFNSKYSHRSVSTDRISQEDESPENRDSKQLPITVKSAV